MSTGINTIAYLKRQAKKLKKELGISHVQALDLVAKKATYNNWKHCLQEISLRIITEVREVEELVQPSFTNWLKRHKNRNSPLGDLAIDMLRDKTWPSYNSLKEYRSHLMLRNSSQDAIATLASAWKSYRAFLKRKSLSVSSRQKKVNQTTNNHDPRKIVLLRNIVPINYVNRSTEKFTPGEKAWISWNGKKALPVTVIQVGDTHYSVRIERPLKKAGNQHSLFLDEVRSSPVLACMNYVTF